MRAIINGFRYDTERADLLGSASHGESTTDFSYWGAGLYRTKRSRNFFLAGSGGPMTRYSRNIGNNNTSGGERIDPMTKAEALEWAERYLEPDEIEAAFVEDIQDA